LKILSRTTIFKYKGSASQRRVMICTFSPHKKEHGKRLQLCPEKFKLEIENAIQQVKKKEN
jgi:hypothetical protein